MKEFLLSILSFSIIFSMILPVSASSLEEPDKNYTIIEDDMFQSTYIELITKQITAAFTNCNSTYQAVKVFASGNTGVYESYVSSMSVTGIEGQTVVTIRPNNPYYPQYAQ